MQVTEFWKRLLALVLCFVMILSTIPTAALATAISEEESFSEDYSEEDFEQEEDPLSPEKPAAEEGSGEDAEPPEENEEPAAPAPEEGSQEDPAQPETPAGKPQEDPVVPEDPETVLPEEEAEPEEEDEEEYGLAPLDLPATVSIKASFIAQWNGEFATKPLLDMTVSSDTAESYGFTDQTDSETEVSTVDVLVAAHVAKYGDAFTKDTAGNYLVISGNFTTTLFGHDSGGNLCILVNGEMPGNNGIEQAAMKDGDILELFEYQSTSGDYNDGTQYLDKYLWLETTDGQKLDGGSLDGGVATELVVKGYAPFYANFGEAGKTTTVSGASLYMVNMENGELTALNATSGADGKVTVTIPKEKIGETIYLTAKGTEMAMSLNEVTVTAPPATSGTTLSGLEVAVGGDTFANATTQSLTPEFVGETKSYTTPILDYVASSSNRYVWVKVGAAEGAKVTAKCASSETVTLTSGEWARVAVKTMSWGTASYSGCLETGKYNTLTITVTADGQTETYTVTIPMQPDTSKSKLSWKTDLAEMTYCNPGSQGKVLSVEAQYDNRPLDDKNEITYQWYTASTADGEGTALDGQTGASYTAPTTDVGVKYYYAVATCGAKTLTSKVIAVHVTEDTAPTSITLVCDYKHTIPDTWAKALGGVDYVAKIGDTLTLRALDQDGKETPVQWPTNLTTGTLSATTGSTVEYTIANTSYAYFTVSSLFDSTVKSEEKALVVKDYSISTYYKNPTATLATDGQSNPTISTNGGLGGYVLWTYEMSPNNVAKLTSDLSKKSNSLSFQALRPGTITASFDLDLDGDGNGDGLTDTATLTIKGIAVEDAAGNLGKTYLETSSRNANPTVQLKALSSTEDATFTWSSADETIATVDENGLVTAQGVGSVIISAKDGTYTGGIKVVVTSANVPYFEALDFTTATTWGTGLSNTSWKSANFKPATLSYTGLTMTKAAADTLTFSASTLYNTEKWVATATYTDADGAEQSVTIASGATTALKNLALETSTITVTLASKDNENLKTVYTFEVTRPRDTTKTIANGGIVFTPEGRDLWKDKYAEKTEGVMYVADADGNFTSGQGASYVRPYYRVYAMNALESFTLTLKGNTEFTHLRYSVDDGENWIYLGQTGAEGQKTQPITFPERTDDDTNPVVKVTVQILDDATYTTNVKAGKDGFDGTTPTSHYVWVEQIGVISAECDILTATTPSGDWYPEFKPERTSYRLVTGVGAELPTLTYTVSDGAKVYLGEELQTPDEDGKYTLVLTEESQSIVVKASNGMTEKTYSFGAKAKLSNLYPDKVVDYLSINSQYTNGYGGYGIGPQQTLTGGLLSLGNFGGYVTFYYEDGLTDDPSHPYGVDFYVDGNAFVDTSTGTGLGSMEPGQVWVSEDGNTWYALAGSEHYEDRVLWNYSVTYSKTETGGTTWVDNQGNTSASTHGRAFQWPDASIYTMNDLASKDSITLTGVLIPCVDGTVAGTDNFNSFSSGGRFGYVDMLVNGTSNPYAYNGDYKNASTGFDLAWAVDASGNPVDVSGKSFHYVKVVTASNLVAGLANEKSTEVDSVRRVPTGETAVGKTTAPAGVTFTSSDNSYVLDFESGKTTYEVELPNMDSVSITVNGTSEGDNIYINNQRVTSGTAAKGFSISTDSQRLIRIIVQNGEKEPVIYLLKVKNKPAYKLGSLTLWKNQTYYNNGDDPIAYEPAFDSDVYEYTTSVPDHVYSKISYMGLRVKTDVIPTPSEVVTYKYSGSWGVNNVGKTDETGHIERYISPYQGTVSIKLDGSDNTYKIKVNQYATLKALTIDGIADQTFDKDITTYNVYADGEKDGIAITATGFKTNYTITINGKEVTNGSSYTLPYDWNDNGEMKAEIQVSASGMEAHTYTVNLKKMPREDKPFIISQSSEADYTVIDTASYVKDLFVIASANGELSYQWFYNTWASTEGGTAIDNATASTYTPPITEDVIGTRYYYCQITNSGAETGNVTYSTPTRVTVDPDPTPVATILNPGTALEGYSWDVGYVYAPDAEATPLEGSYTVANGVEGKITFSWSRRKDGYTGAGIYSAGTKTDEKTLTPMTDISMANDTGWYYYLDVVNEFKGRSYSAHATTGKTYTDASGKTYDVLGVYVFVEVENADVPQFTKQPVGASYYLGESMTSLSVTATKTDGGTLKYQWYVNDSNSTEGATAIEKATSTTYALGKANEESTKYYYCVATNTVQGHTAETVSDIVEIKIRDRINVIGEKLNGSGTAEDPFLINTAEDYQAVADLVAQKLNFDGMYLKQTTDITLPDGWEGIGCRIDPSVNHINAGKNMAAFSGTLDGNGHTITIPEGGLPLFGYVKGATVKNLNIYGKKIAGYGLVNHLEGVSLSGSAIVIDNVTLKSGSATEKAGFIGTYITNNGFAGCSAGYTVTIRNSTIEKDVVVGYNADQSMIGSFAGRIHGTIENCVSYATVKGTDYVGGILGTVDNAMGVCVVRNSQFYGSVEASGEHAGGILGGGYCNSTAPNGVVPTITGCTVKGSVTGADKVGGIMGGDSFVAQSWGSWTMTGNTFSGTVKATEGTYVGGIVGYLLSMNKFTGISDNYYITDNVDHAIGFVKYLDTSFENPVAFEGTVVFDTSKGTDACPTVAGCSWKTNHNRTDDPLNEETTVTGQATAIASISGKTQLLAGASTTLKALDENDKAITTATWMLAEGDDTYATLTVSKGVATVRALSVSESHKITLTAHTSGGADRKVTLTLIPKAQGITLSGDATVTVDIGEENYTAPTFTATVLPKDATQDVTWVSSNKKVGTVENGKLTLTGTLGTTKITATTTDGSRLSASVTVNVVKLAQSIVLSGNDSITGGKAATYAAAEDDGTAIKASNILWSLSDTTYASVNTSGKVTTKAVPETVELTLTATIKDSDRSVTKPISIIPAATYVDILGGESVFTGQNLSININTMPAEATVDLTAKVYPEHAEQKVTWTSSNNKVATVEDGKVAFAEKTGTATITAATENGKKATMKITYAALSTSVTIAKHESTITSGEKLTLSASTDLEKVGVNWTLMDAADKNYVTLSGNKLKAKTVYEKHDVTLVATAKDGGATATTIVTIQPKAGILVLKSGETNVTKTTQSVNLADKTYALSAAVGEESKDVTWKTSNKKIVSLSATEGSEVTLNLLKAGTATITATAADGSKTTVTIKVTTLVESLNITGSKTVASGKSVTLKAVATPTTAANKAVTWSVEGIGSFYASISSSGKLTANKNLMSEKKVMVVATAKDGSGMTATKEVTILPVATDIRINEKAQTVDMQKTKTLQLNGKVYPATANQAINWTSSNAKIATVDAEGKVTFHKGGTVTITATTADGSNKKATVKLTVVKSVESMELDNNFLAGGKSLNLAKLLEVGPSDATNKKVVWTMTGDTAYATLSSNGTLKAKTVTQPKTVTVTATAADGYGAYATATIEIYPATTKVAIQVDGETVTGTLKLAEGDSLQLSAVSLPLDAYQDWTWTSSKSDWAEVDETGCVTGLTAGKTVTITAAAKDGTNKKTTIRIQITAE